MSYIAVREEKKSKGHFQSHFPLSIMRQGKDLHCVHCAILSSDSITHQTLQDMRKDPRITQMPTVARQLSSRQSNARCSKCFSRQSQKSEPINSKQNPLFMRLMKLWLT